MMMMTTTVSAVPHHGCHFLPVVREVTLPGEVSSAVSLEMCHRVRSGTRGVITPKPLKLQPQPWLGVTDVTSFSYRATKFKKERKEGKKKGEIRGLKKVGKLVTSVAPRGGVAVSSWRPGRRVVRR
jgi:hypothetical protein